MTLFEGLQMSSSIYDRRFLKGFIRNQIKKKQGQKFSKIS